MEMFTFDNKLGNKMFYNICPKRWFAATTKCGEQNDDDLLLRKVQDKTILEVKNTFLESSERRQTDHQERHQQPKRSLRRCCLYSTPPRVSLSSFRPLHNGHCSFVANWTTSTLIGEKPPKFERANTHANTLYRRERERGNRQELPFPGIGTREGGGKFRKWRALPEGLCWPSSSPWSACWEVGIYLDFTLVITELSTTSTYYQPW